MNDPRPYQVEALNVLDQSMQRNLVSLLQAATGAGKTFMVCRLIQRYYKTTNRSFLIVMHKKELVRQFYDTFKTETDIDLYDIGICCASENRKETDRRITIATVQTLINQLNVYPGADLVIVDETHRTGFENGDTQYDNLLSTLRNYKPNHRLLGITATAYRLGHGMIYGNDCKPGRTNFFPALTHRIPYTKLLDEGFLLPLKGYVGGKPDLSQIDLSKGEYNITQAGSVMIQHVSSIYTAIEKYCNNHSKIAVLACTIEHAEKIKEAIEANDEPCAIVHSKQTALEQRSNLIKWTEGKTRICVSVNILYEGFDFPQLSCLITARPTKSPVVYIQAVGRVLRTYAGQDEALLIDLAGWVEEFGLDLDNPRFKIPKADGGGEVPEKVCPGVFEDGLACGERLHPAVRICPNCEYEFTEESCEALLPELKEISFGKVLDEPRKLRVEYTHIAIHNDKLLRIQYDLEYGIKVSDWICFPDKYQGYAVEMGMQKWEKYTNTPYPPDVNAAEWLANDGFLMPEYLMVQKDGKFEKIVDYIFAKKEESEEVPF